MIVVQLALGCGPAAPLLPAQLPGYGRDRSSQSERAPQGRSVPRRALEPEDDADLRSAAAARDAEYCGEDFDLSSSSTKGVRT